MAGSRLLVHRSVHDALVAKIVSRARAIKIGDPCAAETGPLATEPQYRKVLSFFESAAAEGATVAVGGHAADGLGGYFVQPTVLTNVKPTMTVAREEVFGDAHAFGDAHYDEFAHGISARAWHLRQRVRRYFAPPHRRPGSRRTSEHRKVPI
jgi:hypothetical protein